MPSWRTRFAKLSRYIQIVSFASFWIDVVHALVSWATSAPQFESMILSSVTEFNKGVTKDNCIVTLNISQVLLWQEENALIVC